MAPDPVTALLADVLYQATGWQQDGTWYVDTQAISTYERAARHLVAMNAATWITSTTGAGKRCVRLHVEPFTHDNS